MTINTKNSNQMILYLDKTEFFININILEKITLPVKDIFSAPGAGCSSITWTVQVSYRTRFAPCDILKVFEFYTGRSKQKLP